MSTYEGGLDRMAYDVEKGFISKLLQTKELEDYEEDALDRLLKKVFKDKADTAIIYTSVIIALVFSVVIFILGPTILTNLLKSPRLQ